MNKKWLLRIWSARLLVAAVTLMNLQAAFYFIFRPNDFAPAFELSGEPGRAMIQGVGLLFLMWCVPYMFAAVQPVRNFTSLIQALIMQAIGVIGESVLFLMLKGEHPQIHASVLRFIIFDAGGLVLLLLALTLAANLRRRHAI